MNKKYYFISYEYQSSNNGKEIRNIVIKEQHPLLWQSNMSRINSTDKYIIIFFAEITETEFNRFRARIN